MKDKNKTKEQLLDELAALRQRISRLEKSESELRYTQDMLRESEEKYRNLVEQANDGIAIIQDKLLEYTNPRTAEIIGYSAIEITGTPFTEYLHPDELPKVAKYYRQRMAGEKVPSRYESIILHKDGHSVFVEINANLITYQGKPADLVIVRDISERMRAEEALRGSEEKYRSLVENTEDPIYLVDKDSRYLFVNKKNLSRFGLAFDQVIGKTYSKFHSKEETKIFQKCINSVFKTGKSLTREHKSHRDGRFFLRTYSSVKDDKGKVEAVTVISKDITDLKKTEDALKESEERYRELVEKAGIAILIDDKEGNVKYFNKKYAELFGYSEEEMKKQTIFSTVHPDEVDRVTRFHKNRIQGKKAPSRYEFRGIKKDGSTICLEVNAVKLKEGNNIIGSRSYIWDITERKQAVEALRESEEKFRSIVETAYEGILVTDAQNKIVFPNRRMAEMLGYTEDEMKGKSMFSFMDREWKTIAEANLKARRPGVMEKRDFKFRCKDGTELWAIVTTNPYFDKKGRYAGSLEMITNITERKKAEEALQASEAFNFALFQYNPMEIIVVDYAGKIIKTNLARRKSGIRWPNIGDVMYKDYAAEHEIDMYAELMDAMRSKKTKDFPELKYNNKYLSIIIAPFPMGAIIISQDITKLKQAERQIKASLREKEILLQEIHHRVKNNMQVISSILNLQSRSIKSKKALEIFKSSQDRVRSMALIHEKLYQSKDFAKVDFSRYVQSLTGYLFNSYGISSEAIRLTTHIKDISLGINSAIPCGLIINELVSNSLKHAFPDRKKGEIQIALHPLNENEIELTVSDNGIGMPKEIDIRHTKSLGLHLIYILAEDQLQGEIRLDRTRGTTYKIRLKVKK